MQRGREHRSFPIGSDRPATVATRLHSLSTRIVAADLTLASTYLTAIFFSSASSRSLSLPLSMIFFAACLHSTINQLNSSVEVQSSVAALQYRLFEGVQFDDIKPQLQVQRLGGRRCLEFLRETIPFLTSAWAKTYTPGSAKTTRDLYIYLS